MDWISYTVEKLFHLWDIKETSLQINNEYKQKLKNFHTLSVLY